MSNELPKSITQYTTGIFGPAVRPRKWAAERPIYYRVVLQFGTRVGEMRDLKTLKGACARLRKRFPSWRNVETSWEPFTS